MANLAQCVNVLQAVILTDKAKMILTPTYFVMQMYSVHQDAKLLPVKFESPLYTLNNNSLPAISVSASKDSNGRVHVSIVNVDFKKENTIEVNLSDTGAKDFKATIITSKTVQDHNTFDNPSKIQIKEFKNFKNKKEI